jgi:hypothetical protein
MKVLYAIAVWILFIQLSPCDEKCYGILDFIRLNQVRYSLSPYFSAGEILELKTSYEDFRAIGGSGLELHEKADSVLSEIDPTDKLRFSVNYADRKGIWRGGKLPYFHSSEKVVYNGQFVTELQSSGMDFVTEKPLDQFTCAIMDFDPDEPPVSPLQTGQGFLTSYAIFNSNGLLHSVASRIPNTNVTIVKDDPSEFTFNVAGQVKQTSYEIDVNDIVTLDPTRSYALTKLESKETLTLNGNTTVESKEIKVLEFKEVSKGLFFPARATLITQRNGKITRQFNFTCQSAQKTSEAGKDYFSTLFPPKTHVYDKRFGVEYTTGDKPSELIQELKQYVNGKAPQ